MNHTAQETREIIADVRAAIDAMQRAVTATNVRWAFKPTPETDVIGVMIPAIAKANQALEVYTKELATSPDRRKSPGRPPLKHGQIKPREGF